MVCVVICGVADGRKIVFGRIDRKYYGAAVGFVRGIVGVEAYLDLSAGPAACGGHEAYVGEQAVAGTCTIVAVIGPDRGSGGFGGVIVVIESSFGARIGQRGESDIVEIGTGDALESVVDLGDEGAHAEHFVPCYLSGK